MARRIVDGSGVREGIQQVKTIRVTMLEPDLRSAVSHHSCVGRTFDTREALDRAPIEQRNATAGYCAAACRRWYVGRSLVNVVKHPDMHPVFTLSLIHISEPTRPYSISYCVFCL